MKHIIVTDDPVNGFTFIGPFDGIDEALEFGNANPPHHSVGWWIAPIADPKEPA